MLWCLFLTQYITPHVNKIIFSYDFDWSLIGFTCIEKCFLSICSMLSCKHITQLYADGIHITCLFTCNLILLWHYGSRGFLLLKVFLIHFRYDFITTIYIIRQYDLRKSKNTKVFIFLEPLTEHCLGFNKNVLWKHFVGRIIELLLQLFLPQDNEFDE